MLNRPQVWTLNILAWLVLFPSVTRKALEAFDCVELLGQTYLRADPAIAQKLLVIDEKRRTDPSAQKIKKHEEKNKGPKEHECQTLEKEDKIQVYLL